MPACQFRTGTDVPRDAFIRAMRMVASSVTVVTTDGPAGRHGATVSAFTSVSADPPTILVCLRADSRIAQAVEANGQLCVNVLPSESRAIADRFAGKDDTWLEDRFSGIECFGRPVPRRRSTGPRYSPAASNNRFCPAATASSSSASRQCAKVWTSR